MSTWAHKPRPHKEPRGPQVAAFLVVIALAAVVGFVSVKAIGQAAYDSVNVDVLEVH